MKKTVIECPKCGSTEETGVLDVRQGKQYRYIRRRRQCHNCGGRFTTYETAINSIEIMQVVKQLIKIGQAGSDMLDKLSNLDNSE